MSRFALPVSLLLCLGATASVGQQISATVVLPCVTPPEAESLVTSILPELLLQAGQVCATSLPPTALMRQTAGPFIDRYRQEAERAWPQAQTAIGKVGGPMAQAAVGSSIARPLIATLIAPLITKQLRPADCPAIDRILTLAEPLPPRNTAGLVVAILQLSNAKHPDKPAPLSICSPGRR